MSDQSSDLLVEPISQCLKGKSIDLVVTGSVAAIETPRLARSLRRLGAEVYPCMSQGARFFIGKEALAWACHKPVLDQFGGLYSHIAHRDVCVVAPASADFMRKIALGYADEPASCLVQSYLGQNKKVLILATMHQSLYDAPAILNNKGLLNNKNIDWLAVREEEGKRKMPLPSELADLIAHKIQSNQLSQQKVVVNLGATRSYLDDLRFISNKTSGALGTYLVEELFRRGVNVQAIVASAFKRPHEFVSQVDAVSYDEMYDALMRHGDGAQAVILAAAVNDYGIENPCPGKKDSSQAGSWVLKLKRLPKLINQVKAPVKIAFKLENQWPDTIRSRQLFEEYFVKYHLSLLVCNVLTSIDESGHEAWFMDQDFLQNGYGTKRQGKKEIAYFIADYVVNCLKQDVADEVVD